MNRKMTQIDTNREYERLHFERQRLMDQRLNLAIELESVSRIKGCFEILVAEKCKTTEETSPFIQKWLRGGRELHQLYTSIQSDIMEIRVELDRNQAKMRALRRRDRSL